MNMPITVRLATKADIKQSLSSRCTADFEPAYDRCGVRLGHPGDVRCMTDLPPKAEVDLRSCYVAEVPIVLQKYFEHPSAQH